MSTYREKSEDKAQFTCRSRCQRTISKKVSVQGMGLFSGEEVTMTFYPAESGTGVVFKRIDLPGSSLIKASIDNLKATPRCTIIGVGHALVQCVEHALSALSSFNVDNLIIELDGPEVPIFDGSANYIIKMLDQAGILEQNKQIDELYLKAPLHVSHGEMTLIALPADKLSFSYTLSYPGHPLMDSQFYSFDFTEELYRSQIAPCRTFAPLKEVEDLIKQKVIKNISLDTGLVLNGSKVVGAEGLRFSNEMARHKILDLIGDLSLIGKPVIAHFVSIKSGHYLNTLLAKMLDEKIGEELYEYM